MTRTAAAETAASSRATLWWARTACLSVFGPYVTGSARTEQIAVFTSLAAVLVTGWPRIVKARSFAPLPVLALWLGICAVMLTASVSRPFDPGFYGALPASHALSFMLLPVALITVTWYWTLSARAAELIRAIAPVIVAAMTANTGIALAQFVTGNVAVVSFLPRFWDTPGSAGPVAVLAAGNFRFTGIFDQPAEAGVAYGVALLCLIWLSRRRIMRSGILVTLCTAAVITGGVLTVSKVFLLGAVPLAVLTVLWSTGRVRAAGRAAAAGAAAWLLAGSGMLPAWPAGAAVLRLARPSGALVSQYSAGRYGTGGTLGPVVSDVLRASPWYGFGAGGLNVAYDSLWVEVMVVAGVFGAALLTLFLLVLGYRWLSLHRTLERPEWLLAGAVLALAIGASAGLPSLTANRAASLLWMVMGVLLASGPRVSRRHGRIQDAVPRPRSLWHATAPPEFRVSLQREQAGALRQHSIAAGCPAQPPAHPGRGVRSRPVRVLPPGRDPLGRPPCQSS